MGLITLAMAALTLAGAAAALVLAAMSPAAAAETVLWLAAGAAMAAAAEQIDKLIRRAAPRATAAAWVAAILPFAVQLGFQSLAWRAATNGLFGPAPSWSVALVTYLVATGPWTLLGVLAPGAFRTVRAVRAYGGHLAFWLLAIGRGGLGLSEPAAIALAACAAVLPVGVAFLVARADPDVIRSVRV